MRESQGLKITEQSSNVSVQPRDSSLHTPRFMLMTPRYEISADLSAVGHFLTQTYRVLLINLCFITFLVYPIKKYLISQQKMGYLVHSVHSSLANVTTNTKKAITEAPTKKRAVK